MSDTHADPKTSALAHAPTSASPAADQKPQLADLMADGPKSAAPKADGKSKTGPDLDGQALRAAEQALAEGERALATARAQLAAEPGAANARQSKGRSGRELALRLLLAANVVAMLVVAMLPGKTDQRAVAPSPSDAKPAASHTEPTKRGPRTDDKYAAALLAADRQDFPRAISLLQEYLADSPRMAASSQASALLALEYYCSRAGRLGESQEYRRRIQALNDSHKLPEDLVAMAQAAAKSGDQESLRRVWARFLLQQRQVPSSLYKHLAEAYLQLGDSYRAEANEAAERERVRQLEETAAKLREQVKTPGENGK